MKMSNGRITLEIREHIILRNFWEYYITTHYPENSDIQEALVMGDFVEIGDVSLSEMKPYIISKSKNLKGLAPAEGYRWVKEKTR